MPSIAIVLLMLAIAATGLTGCSLFAGHSPTAPTSAPVLSGITPSAAAVGDTITISGSAFTPTGNSVKIGAGYLLDVATPVSTSLRFILPAALTPCPPGTQICVALALLVTPGTYQIAVVNANGTSNELPLQVVAK